MNEATVFLIATIIWGIISTRISYIKGVKAWRGRTLGKSWTADNRRYKKRGWIYGATSAAVIVALWFASKLLSGSPYG